MDMGEILEETGPTYAEYPISQMELDQLKEELYKLDAQEPEIKKFFAKKKAVMDRFQQLVGSGFQWDGDECFGEGIHWQDSKGRVWATVRCDGKYVAFTPFDVIRTRCLEDGESKGELSMSKARKMGYVVEGK